MGCGSSKSGDATSKSTDEGTTTNSAPVETAGTLSETSKHATGEFASTPPATVSSPIEKQTSAKMSEKPPSSQMSGAPVVHETVPPTEVASRSSSKEIGGNLKSPRTTPRRISSTNEPSTPKSSAELKLLQSTPPAAEPFHPLRWVQSCPEGMYGVISEGSNGTFLVKYSRTFVDDAVVYARPSQFATLQTFKYDKPIVVQARLQSGRETYYQAWCNFFKQARSVNAEVLLLPSFEDLSATPNTEKAYPTMRIFFLFGTKVVEAERGAKAQPINLKYADVVAVVPESYNGFQAALKPKAEIERKEFISIAKAPQHKYYLEFTAG